MRKKRYFWTNFIIHLLCIVAVSLRISSSNLSQYSLFAPLLDLILIFHFAIYRNNIKLLFVFLLGFWVDALNMSNLGLNAISYVICTSLFIYLKDRITIKENSIQILYLFISYITILLLIKYVILSIFSGNLQNFTILLVRIIATSFCYLVLFDLIEKNIRKIQRNN